MSSSRLKNNTLNTIDRYWTVLVPLISVTFTVLVLATGINQSLFLRLNSLSQYTGQSIWSMITLFGDGLIAFVLILPLVHRRPDIVWHLFVAALIAILVSNGLKQIFAEVHRPPGIFDHSAFTIIGPAYSHHSFPSGHTTTAFTLAGVLAIHAKRPGLKFALLAAALMVGLSRIMVGIHWPSDVGAGAAIGTGAAILGIMLGSRFPWGTSRLGQHIMGSLLFIAAFVLLLSYQTGYDDMIWLQRGIAVTCLICGLNVPIEIMSSLRNTHRT